MEYGLILTGKIQIESLLDANAAMALRHKLDLARLELKMTLEIYNSNTKSLNDRIVSLEGELVKLHQIVYMSLSNNATSLGAFNILLSEYAKNPEVVSCLNEIHRELRSGNVNKAQLQQSLVMLQSTSPSALERLAEICRSTFSGAAGTLLAEGLKAVLKIGS